MISDNDLYTLAIFLGSLAMLLIVLYHFLEVNAIEDGSEKSAAAAAQSPQKGGIKGMQGGAQGVQRVVGVKV